MKLDGSLGSAMKYLCTFLHVKGDFIYSLCFIMGAEITQPDCITSVICTCARTVIAL